MTLTDRRLTIALVGAIALLALATAAALALIGRDAAAFLALATGGLGVLVPSPLSKTATAAEVDPPA